MEYELISQKLCMTKDIGMHGNLFGGLMLAWADEAGAIFASQVCGTQNIVTVHISEVDFKKPVKTGNLIKIFGKVEKMGTTSITIDLIATRHDPTSMDNVDADNRQTPRILLNEVCRMKMVFVCIDDDGKPTAIPSKK